MAPAPSKPIVARETKWKRALRALPLLFIFYAADRTFGTSLRMLEPLISSDGTRLDLGDGVVVPFCSGYFGLPALDGIISMFTAFFAPSIGGFDKVGRVQAIAFLADLVPMQIIWMVEGSRVSNSRALTSRFRTLFMLLAQILGIGYIAPIYYFIQYVECPLEPVLQKRERGMMVNRKERKAILPSIGIAYVLPSMAMFAVPGLINRQWINGVFFQPFPLYAFAVQRLLKKAVTDPGEKVKEEEVEKATEEDLHSLRLIYGISAALSGSVYLYLWTTSPFLLNEIFFFNVSNPTAPITMLKGAAKVLRYDQICAFGASAVWTLLHFWDLKREGLISGVGWGRILGVFAGMSVVGGPGAAMCGMWGWREEVLNGRN